jgi:hypothetical protein
MRLLSAKNSERGATAARTLVRMPPLLLVHITGGAVGLLSGGVAMSFRKGSRWHRIAGKRLLRVDAHHVGHGRI